MNHPPTRTIPRGFLAIASIATLVLAAFLVWTARQWDAATPLPAEQINSTLTLQHEVQLLGQRIGGLELLLTLVLGAAGIYFLVFLAAAYTSAASLTGQMRQAVLTVERNVDTAMLQIRSRPPKTIPETPAATPQPSRPPRHDESFAAMEQKLHRRIQLGMRAGGGSPEIHYDWACFCAQMPGLQMGNRETCYQFAIEHLIAAFRNPSRQLEDWLARDLEEGGVLFELANTPPFDQAVNDILQNVIVGLGSLEDKT